MPSEFNRIRRDPWLTVGLLLLLLLAGLSLLGPLLTPHDPHDMSFMPLSTPSAQHWLGVNDGGMDIYSELVHSLRNTLWFGLLAGVCGLLLGATGGLAAAWYGGWLDQLLMRLADIILALPAILVLILLAAFFRPDPAWLALTLAALAWPNSAKVIRAQALGLKNQLHLQAARRMGASVGYLLRRHLLPELFPLYLVALAAKIRMAVFMEATLAFLGLFDPARKSLGMMISYALKYYYLEIWPYWLLPPIICLTLLIMGATFLAVSLEKFFDPRLREL
ncbi:ABC transporter permease [Desulfurivibrio dismutans]|uniref:ABC transporter permease n=1 Tax=Desulfurivibrio dismutans TaxID=1398908 RepID=UPI0023DA6AFF|nr:ABC transporter permease [Desulfurivibrio alkaliphilus]MDF1615103.1 ABC transporter permease [Desulfurivibrio alkaliphilus]